jgi:hypothetical protein
VEVVDGGEILDGEGVERLVQAGQVRSRRRYTPLWRLKMLSTAASLCMSALGVSVKSAKSPCGTGT